MIEFFRTRVKDSVFVKIFLGLLAASFGIWGVGDFMSSSRLNPGVSIKVGSVEVKTSALQRQYNRDLDRFRQATNGQNIPEEIVKRTVIGQTVQEMTRSATIDEAADKVGLRISQDQLRAAVFDQKPFQDNGKFSRMKFEELLAANNLTESGYLSLFETSLREVMMMQPVAVNAGAPKYLIQSLFLYRNESRVADTLLVPNTAMALQTTPSDDEMKAVYDKNVSMYTAPEYRKLTVLTLTAADLVKPDSIDDAQAKTYYDENAARYRTPETKRIAQIIFESKEKAEAVRAQATPGETLDALAAKTKSGPAVDLGELTADSPVLKMLGPDAFKAAVGEISPPVQSQLGWHLVEVKSATPESTKPFEAVKEAVKTTIAADKGNDAVYGASVQLEDALAAGTPLADIAKNIGGQVAQVEAIDNTGKGHFGANVTTPVEAQALTKAAFDTPSGKDSKLMDMPSRDGYFVVHVDEVTPAAPKPLELVRALVATLWQNEQKQKQAQELADKLAKDIGPSTQMSAIESQDKRISYAPLGPINRFGEGLDRKNVVDAKRISPDMLEKLFKAKAGDVIVAPVSNGMLVARLKDVIPAVPTDIQTAQLAQGVRKDIGSNLMDQVSKAFAARWPAEVDQKTIDGMIGVR